jgi:hypothetical protein
VHVRLERRCANEVVEAERIEFVPSNELVIFISRARGLVFHLFGDVFEEAGPPGCRAELRDIVGTHLDAFVRGEEETTIRDVVNVVEVVCGGD